MLVFIILIPPPALISNNTFSILQYVSTEIAAWVMRFSGISVYLEGNTIDLGGYYIEGNEVCDCGVIYPLLLAACLIILLLNISRWLKLGILVSTVIVMILVNSGRILVASALYESYGEKATNVFLEYYGSIALLMTSIVILLVFVYVLVVSVKYLRAEKKILINSNVSENEKNRNIKFKKNNKISIPILLVLALILLRICEILPSSKSEYTLPKNIAINDLPTKIGEWVGERNKLNDIDIKNLHLTEYVLADYRNSSNVPVTLLVVYYATQESGKSSHSPRTCLPGSGWAMQNQTKELLIQAKPEKMPLYYNRLQAIKGQNRQLVYYWYQQRGRNITNELILKWYLFLDAFTKNRTDGTLVRVTTTLNMGETWQDADKRLLNFITKLHPILSRYLPD
jgi:exosortase D (VPLPA-CTERM-specific)